MRVEKGNPEHLVEATADLRPLQDGGEILRVILPRELPFEPEEELSVEVLSVSRDESGKGQAKVRLKGTKVMPAPREKSDVREATLAGVEPMLDDMGHFPEPVREAARLHAIRIVEEDWRLNDPPHISLSDLEDSSHAFISGYRWALKDQGLLNEDPMA